MMTSVLRSVLVAIGLVKRPEFTVSYSLGQPSKSVLKVGQIVVVGDRLSPKWAVLRCPGQCDHIMRLPLKTSSHPHWSVKNDWLGRATVFPSIHQKNACFAHFWIKEGMTLWCKDSGCQ